MILQHTFRERTKPPPPSGPMQKSDLIVWENDMFETCTFIDAILDIIDPRLARVGRDVMDKIKADAAARHSDDRHHKATAQIQSWPTVFNAVQIICNRASIYHRDSNAPQGWFDGLLSVGEYEQRLVLSLRNLGICVPYDSGSLCFLSSKVVVHGVPDVDRNRLCIAFFMDDSVHHHYQAPSPGWTFLSEGASELPVDGRN